MSKISVYNYGKYSVFDIEEHLKKKGYEEDKKLYLHLQRKFRIGKVKNYPETIKRLGKN